MAPAPAKLNPTEEQPDDVRHVEQGEIAKLAYERWLERGCRDGSSAVDWFTAEEDYARGFR